MITAGWRYSTKIEKLRDHNGIYVLELELVTRFSISPIVRRYTFVSKGDGLAWRELVTGERPDDRLELEMSQAFLAWFQKERE